jgi:amino acid transporter, AAT family
MTSAQVETDNAPEEGYERGLGSRQVQMIAIGGAVGVGLFLGAGANIAKAGPSLIFMYALAGVIIFFIMRALGELLLYRPVSGSFAEYSREFLGPFFGYFTAWTYWLMWVVTGMAELTAAAIYVNYWFPAVSQWVTALAFLVILFVANLISVKLFGEIEFWFSMVKVTALIGMIVIGLGVLTFGFSSAGDTASVANLWQFDGFFPKGIGSSLMTLQGVMFAYLAVELVGVTAGESENPEKTLPKAINTLPWRIALFYVGALTVILCVVKWTEFAPGVSPFVEAFAKIGIPAGAGIVNFVVLTAALSSCNSGLYSIGRVFRTMANNGHAPQWLTKMSKRHVPYAAILAIAAFYLVGILLNIWLGGSHAFDLALNTASIGVIFCWGSIFASQIVLRRRKGVTSSLPMPGSPWTSWAGLVGLLAITVLIGFDTMTSKSGEVFYLGLWTLGTIPFFAVVLWLGWQKVKNNQPKSELYS